MKNHNYPAHHHQENLHVWPRIEKEKEKDSIEIEIAQIAHVGIMKDTEMEGQGIQTIRIHIRTRILTVVGLQELQGSSLRFGKIPMVLYRSAYTNHRGQDRKRVLKVG
jgi:hypothetical protein